MPKIHCFYHFQVFCGDVSNFYKKLNLYIIVCPNLLDMPRPSKKTSQAKAQRHSSTHFVQQCSLVEAGY
ncbi:hypothetical protein C8R48DRAFT_709867 [Suillus tomentosus]|nr:hypothetical protein C8R48DRAFT_709867 [Suillus tomentosus]